jgi:hypothetical protein
MNTVSTLKLKLRFDGHLFVLSISSYEFAHNFVQVHHSACIFNYVLKIGQPRWVLNIIQLQFDRRAISPDTNEVIQAR